MAAENPPVPAGNITVDVLAEALRRVADPSVNERIKLQERPDVKHLRRVPCQSPSGARFTAVIADSKTFTDFGRVISLEDYQYPHSEEIEYANLPCHKNATFNWGRGAQVLATGEHNVKLPMLTREAKQTLATMTWQRDLKEYVGQMFMAHIALPEPVTATVEVHDPKVKKAQ